MYHFVLAKLTLDMLVTYQAVPAVVLHHQRRGEDAEIGICTPEGDARVNARSVTRRLEYR
eukprot:899984-Amorphochlora_amoeboformis.AAC.1